MFQGYSVFQQKWKQQEYNAMLFRDKNTVYSENRKKHKNTVCG
jgi:hypothetical protein